MNVSTLVKNRDRAKQLLAFDGMQYGRCRPTDIDLSVDFQGNMFVFAELKGVGVQLTLGQRIHLTGLVDAITAGGKQAVAILAHHDTKDCDHDVHCAESIVHSVYYGGGGNWERIFGEITLDKFITDLHNVYQFERKAGAAR